MDIIYKAFNLMFSPERLVSYSGKAIGVVVSLAVIYVLYKLIVLALDRTLKNRFSDERFKMIFLVFRSALRYVAFFVMLITGLQQAGINVTALLTGAGILGLAVSFGSQNLVRDVISGLFIILENQYAVGDQVSISGIKGRVENMSLRLTVLSDEAGTTHTIPNGSITVVQNFSK